MAVMIYTKVHLPNFIGSKSTIEWPNFEYNNNFTKLSDKESFNILC